ncbi:MAG: HD domain-containing phosphohydrolase [Desulfitobacteriaceae bacterium]
MTYYHSLQMGYLLDEFTKTVSGKKFVKQSWVTRNECVNASLLLEIGKTSWPRELLFSNQTLKYMPMKILTNFWVHKIGHPLIAESTILDYFKNTGNRYWERIAKGIAAHHEDFDGGGYPFGLRGSEIPLLARGLRLFDSYTAMIEVRRYRDKIESAQVIKELRGSLGCRYDPFWGEQILSFLKVVKPCVNIDNWLEQYLNIESE